MWLFWSPSSWFLRRKQLSLHLQFYQDWFSTWRGSIYSCWVYIHAQDGILKIVFHDDIWLHSCNITPSVAKIPSTPPTVLLTTTVRFYLRNWPSQEDVLAVTNSNQTEFIKNSSSLCSLTLTNQGALFPLRVSYSHVRYWQIWIFQNKLNKIWAGFYW